MTKKEYIQIAKILKYQLHVYDNEGGNPVNDGAVIALARQFAIMLKADNPLFDTLWFFDTITK